MEFVIFSVKNPLAEIGKYTCYFMLFSISCLVLTASFFMLSKTLEIKQQNEFLRDYFTSECVNGDDLYQGACECVFDNLGLVSKDFEEVINYCSEKIK